MFLRTAAAAAVILKGWEGGIGWVSGGVRGRGGVRGERRGVGEWVSEWVSERNTGACERE